MDAATLIEHASPMMTIFLVMAFVSVIAGLSVGALLISRKAVHPVLAGACTGLLSLGLTVLCVWAATGADAGDIEASRSAVAGATGVLLIAPFFALAPAALHAIMTLGASLREGPRRLGFVLAGVVPALILVAAPAVGGYLTGNGFLPISMLRVVPYGALALLTLPALTAGGEGPSGPASSASASLSLLAFVGIGEASLRGAFAFLMQGRFGDLPDAVAREAFVINARAELLDPTLVWSWIAFAAAAVLAILAHVPAMRRPGGAHTAAGLLWIPLAALPLLLADVPVASWTALAQALP